MMYAAGYPNRTHITVVKNAIFSDLHNTIGKMASEKNLAKFSSVKLKVMMLLPSLVKAYSRISSIGNTTKALIQAM
jgi:hypothetical protein